ncbi:hypothetical protein ROR02_16450 [Pararhodospirillum oryzae]|uniref:Uncharacterized protein n=2 Tax=Pararhodospirillum oryzae TaxID=478448 RepID=A0A512H7V6_9PROT|nr:hypothetical protein ROR02_16450 [Pararhodospirillum oryzae]
MAALVAHARGQAQAGRWSEALGAFARYLSARQEDHAVRLELLETAARAARAGARVPPSSSPSRAGALPFVSVIVCSISDERSAAITALYQRLFQGRPFELVLLRDARSLCEAYTRALSQAQGEILIFSHDDVEILAPDFADRLLGHLARFDVVGFAGTTRLAGPAWIQGGWRGARGQVATRDRASGRLRVDVYGVSGPVAEGIQALDGLCFACRREVAERVGFDAEHFDGFHLYDTDFTWRAFQAGYRLAVATDIPIIHYSTGRLDEVWRGYAARFLAKFPQEGFSGAFGENPLRATYLDTPEELRAFWDIIVAVGAAHPGCLAPVASPVASAGAPAPGRNVQDATGTPPVRLGIPWTLTEVHGWGLVGTHTALYLMERGAPPLLLAQPIMNTLRTETRSRLAPLNDEFASLDERLKSNVPTRVTLPGIDVLHPLGNEFLEEPSSSRFVGRRNIGVIAFENTRLDEEVLKRARRYDFIIAHSTFNCRLLQEAGLSDVRLAFQGIDETDMVRLERRGSLGNRFVVFSGGKLEFRKGQDLVVEAFRRFHARHPEALLVAAWHNPWPALSLDIAEAPWCKVAPRIENNRLQLTRWVMDNGLPPEAFLDLHFLQRSQIPGVLAECDAAVFPNRCEGGTNLVAMECMAMGIPCVLSANTGHLDILREGACYPLRDQRPVTDPQGVRREWGESSVDELVECLEEIHKNRDEARRRGEQAATFIRKERTWRRFAEVFVQEATR